MSKQKCTLKITFGEREEGRPRKQMSEAPSDLKVEELEEPKEPKIAFKFLKKMSIR
jgi:hypothetical protein